MSTQPDPVKATPSQQLATRIANQLVERGLVTADDGARLAPIMSAGKLRREDWRLAIEKTLPSETADE